MHNLSLIELPDLLDMLSGYTYVYMKMLSDGATKEEFDQCREKIIDIQSEIRIRKGREGNSIATP